MAKICWKTNDGRTGEHEMEEADAEKWMEKYEFVNPDVEYWLES